VVKEHIYGEDKAELLYREGNISSTLLNKGDFLLLVMLIK